MSQSVKDNIHIYASERCFGEMLRRATSKGNGEGWECRCLSRTAFIFVLRRDASEELPQKGMVRMDYR